MSSSTRLLVLGVVQIFQPVHGYDVRRELVSWHAHEWAQVKPGSIYNALKSLTRDGLLEVVGTDQVGSRPERTTYRLTAAGTERFHMLLREEWWTVRKPIDPMMAAISFIGYVPRAEAIAALEHRIVQIQSVLRDIARDTAKVDDNEVPLHVREMHRLLSARIGAEIEWAQAFIARLRSGEYTTDDEPRWEPGSEQARREPTRRPSRPTAEVRSARRSKRSRSAPASSNVEADRSTSRSRPQQRQTRRSRRARPVKR